MSGLLGGLATALVALGLATAAPAVAAPAPNPQLRAGARPTPAAFAAKQARQSKATKKDRKPPASLRPRALKRAHVPALCGRRAGKLHGGVLPPPKHQDVADIRYVSSVTGRVGPKRSWGAAVFLNCRYEGDQGFVIFYRKGRHGPVYDGEVSLPVLGPPGFTLTTARSLAPTGTGKNAAIRVRTTSSYLGGDEAGPDAELILKPAKRKRIAVISRVVYGPEWFAATQFFPALAAGGDRAWEFAQYHYEDGENWNVATPRDLTPLALNGTCVRRDDGGGNGYGDRPRWECEATSSKTSGVPYFFLEKRPGWQNYAVTYFSIAGIGD